VQAEEYPLDPPRAIGSAQVTEPLGVVDHGQAGSRDPAVLHLASEPGLGLIRCIGPQAGPVVLPRDRCCPGGRTGFGGFPCARGLVWGWPGLVLAGPGERVGFPGQRGQGGGDLMGGGADVGRGRATLAVAVGVACVRLGDGVAEVPLIGRERFTNPAEYLSLTSGREWHPSSSLRFFVASAASCGSLDATEVAATSFGLMQPGDGIAGHRRFALGPGQVSWGASVCARTRIGSQVDRHRCFFASRSSRPRSNAPPSVRRCRGP
jgi:hypothetical protein